MLERLNRLGRDVQIVAEKSPSHQTTRQNQCGVCLINWGQINIVLARRQTPAHLISPSNQPSPLLRQIVLAEA
jgi:hypothetical protein